MRKFAASRTDCLCQPPGCLLIPCASTTEGDRTPVGDLLRPGIIKLLPVAAVKHGSNLNVDSRLSPFVPMFRHSMATSMLENGADLRFIQAMLGHANLHTTQIYTQVGIKKLQQIHEATHPAKASRIESLAEDEVEKKGEQLPKTSDE